MPLRIARPPSRAPADRTRRAPGAPAKIAPAQIAPARAATPVRGGTGEAEGRGFSALLAVTIWLMLADLLLRWDWLDAGTDLAKTAQSALSSNDRAAKIAWMLVGTAIVLRYSQKAFSVVSFANRGFLVFLAVVPLSILWSISPADTVNRYVSIVSIVMVCWAFGVAAWNTRRYQDVLRPFFTAVLIASVIIGIYLPHWIIEGGDLKDAWHGIVNTKNTFGQVAGFSVIFWAHTWLYENTKWWRAAPFLALAVACLLLSHSSTSLLASTFACFLMILLHRLPPYMRRYMPYIVAFFAVGVLIYLGAVLQLLPGLNILFSPIGALTGKDTTFTDRALIWQIVDGHRALRPLLGSGYGGYWIGPVPSSESYEFLGKMYFYPWETHNGYLEMANDLGWLGITVLFSFLIAYIRQCVALFKGNRAQAVLFIAIFFHQALTNLSESQWLVVTNPIAFIVVTLAVFSLARLLRDQAAARVPARRARVPG
jgi:exopolysaccharide production protein ExoQ